MNVIRFIILALGMSSMGLPAMDAVCKVVEDYLQARDQKDRLQRILAESHTSRTPDEEQRLKIQLMVAEQAEKTLLEGLRMCVNYHSPRNKTPRQDQTPIVH